MDVEQLIKQMTLEEKLGQLFLLAFAGSRLDEARVLLEDYFVGSCYISNDNVPTPEKAFALTSELQRFASSTRLKIPLMLGADQEGAWGVMVPGSCTGPGNMALGATNLPEDAYKMYKVIGQELSAVGLNTLFAPSADCNSNPHNSIIGMRSFGENPRRVAAMTAAAVKGTRNGGAIPTLKHFPGHGDTTTDSHRGIPTVKRSREELFAIDLFPFAEGIKADVDIVMTSHIIFTALDPHRPATLSPLILQDVLRKELGFDGVILTDSMNMKAMKKNYAPEDSAVQAFNAGVDLIMLAEEHYDHDAKNYLRQQIALIEAVKKAVQNGQLLLERVDDAVRRVLSLKARYPLFPKSKTEWQSVGGEVNRKVELEVSRHAVAILRDEANLLPVTKSHSITLVNTTTRTSYDVLGATRGIGPNQTTAAFDYFLEAIRKRYSNLRIFSAEDVLASEGRELNPDSLVVAVTENYPLPGVDFDQKSQSEVIQKLLAVAKDRLIVVALRDPYELSYLNVPTYLCAFSFRPCAAQAAVDVLCGDVKPQGLTSVSVPGTSLKA
jgi:beta-N-acetylhexosaminidase